MVFQYIQCGKYIGGQFGSITHGKQIAISLWVFKDKSWPGGGFKLYTANICLYIKWEHFKLIEPSFTFDFFRMKSMTIVLTVTLMNCGFITWTCNNGALNMEMPYPVVSNILKYQYRIIVAVKIFALSLEFQQCSAWFSSFKNANLVHVNSLTIEY